MPYSWVRRLAVVCMGVIAVASAGCVDAGPPLPGEGADAGRIVLYRDTWGVPHIYAPTVGEGLYAQGWAQAQDRPEQLLLNLLMAIGESASAIGEAGIDIDLRSRLFDHHGTARRGWAELAPEQRAHLQAFADGVNAFYQEHPEDVPEWWRGREVDVYMIVAFGRFFLYSWSIDEAYGDLHRGGIDVGFEPELRGSNQFAVSPRRSAEGAAILAIDPHLSWSGPSRFWELRVHAGPWEGSGVSLPGFPYIGLGHTRQLAWAMTTGGPDTADVYELTLGADGEAGLPRYLYDGEWRELTPRRVTLEVRGAEPLERTLWSSHHGPVIARRGAKAWAAKIAYENVAAPSEAWWILNTAGDHTGAVRAMETLTMFPQNVMVADGSGNIYYQRTGRVPRRPEGFDWSVPVDGSGSATEWLGFHPAADHLQVLNPSQGYMQNCNIPPDAMMPGSPFRLAQSVPYLFSSRDHGSSRDGWTNQRGARAIELLSADASVTAEEAIAYINDVTVYGADRWIEALRLASEADDRGGDDSYRPALEGLLAWDRRSTADSPAALRYDAWRAQLVEDHGKEGARSLAAAIDDHYSIVEGREPRPLDLSPEEEQMLLGSFAQAVKALVEEHGSLDATYGDRHRVGRGEESWPVGGSGHAPGTSTLRALGYDREEKEGHEVWADRGQSSTQVVVMTDPPRSWVYLPLGQSDREDSPHFDDQAEKLFSPRRMKPSWWQPEELALHVESRTVLTRQVGR